MKVSGYEQLSSLSRVSFSGAKSNSISSGVSGLFSDSVSISSDAMEKLNESRKNEFMNKFDDMKIYAADYDDALKLIEDMVVEKKDAADLASCGEYYLIMYHKAALDKGLDVNTRTQIQNNLEEGYVNFIKLRAEKEGWNDGENIDASIRGMIRAMGSKEYYNDYHTPVLEAIIKGDFATATLLRGEWDKIAKEQQSGQINDNDAVRRMKELAAAREEKRRLDAEIQTMKNI